jgi:hypothetical protein
VIHILLVEDDEKARKPNGDNLKGSGDGAASGPPSPGAFGVPSAGSPVLNSFVGALADGPRGNCGCDAVGDAPFRGETGCGAVGFLCRTLTDSAIRDLAVQMA